MITHWITFLLAGLAVVLAGTRLSKFGGAIGQYSGIGQGWIGLLFLATITSIPELTTTITGASIGAPDIAVGNALGSNLFNIAIIAVMDLILLRRGPFLLKVRSYHLISGGMAIFLTSVAVLGMVLNLRMRLLGIGILSWIILLGYVYGIFLLYHAERGGKEGDQVTVDISLARALAGFIFCAVVIITAGVFLVQASKAISIESGLSGSFMGAILVAIVTSLPELATALGAIRIKAYDMILGNIFGSNMFNILTIFFADVAFRQGSILSCPGVGMMDQLVVAILGIGLTVIAIIAIAYRSRRCVLGVGIDAALILVFYLIGTYLIISRGIRV
ncbi:MAG: sodium:calcium antiporter [Candidatus Bipolaricaulota bacterium]|nr:sodium:calcium antiporter [Candidatus Bipolaricaulota bacterium]